jgi:hypothetical protein
MILWFQSLRFWRFQRGLDRVNLPRPTLFSTRATRTATSPAQNSTPSILHLLISLCGRHIDKYSFTSTGP